MDFEFIYWLGYAVAFSWFVIDEKIRERNGTLEYVGERFPAYIVVSLLSWAIVIIFTISVIVNYFDKKSTTTNNKQ